MSINQQLIFFPCLALIFLCALVLVRMFFTRVKAVRSGSVDFRYFKTYDLDINPPILMTQASRNFTNLFEAPTLFYMICAFALMTQNVDRVMYVAAWIYVGLRYIHSFIHLTSNKIGPRMGVYSLSWIILLFMGILLAYKILQAL